MLAIRLPMLCAALAAACWAQTPQAQSIKLEWDLPSGSNPHDVDFRCDRLAGSHSLLVKVVPPEDRVGFKGLSGTIDFVDCGYSPASPFWHWQSGGCNDGGMAIRLVPPTALPRLFTQNAEHVFRYAPDHPERGVGRLRFEIHRPWITGLPDLEAGTEYLAFAIEFFTCGAGACPGCDDPKAIYAGQMTLVGHPTTMYLDPGRTGPMATINYCLPVCESRPATSADSHPMDAVVNRRAEGGPCEPTSLEKNAWGELKVRYR